MASHYEVLGVPKTASEAELRQAYKRAALRWHPDKNPQSRAKAEAMFKKVAEAYRVLTDPRQRAAYDHSLLAPSTTTTAPTTRPAPPVPAREQMEEAYSLFEQFFGGRDPFEDFDSAFDNADSGALDRIFNTLARAKPSAKPGRVGVVGPSRAEARGGPPLASTGRAQVRCVSKQGVAYRRTTKMEDCVRDVRGPDFGDMLEIEERRGDWVRAAAGWLPLTIGGARVFELLEGRVLKVRCVSKQGVAYRRTMRMEDCVRDVRGPDFGHVLEIKERKGDWVRAAAGWLPLTIGGVRVFELLEDAKSMDGLSSVQGWQDNGRQTDNPSQGSWSLSLPSLPLQLLTVLAGSCYVAFGAARLFIRGWWNVSMGFFPLVSRLWR